MHNVNTALDQHTSSVSLLSLIGIYLRPLQIFIFFKPLKESKNEKRNSKPYSNLNLLHHGQDTEIVLLLLAIHNKMIHHVRLSANIQLFFLRSPEIIPITLKNA
jgi:hypothetical protein